MKLMRMIKGAMVLLVLQFGFMQWAEAKTYTVKSNADSGDNTLRWAISEVNKSFDPSNLIQFSFKDSNGDPRLTTIKLEKELPALTKPFTTISGYANGMGTKNSLRVGNNAQLNVVLQGKNSSFNGLVINSFGCEIKGLVLVGFDRAVGIKKDMNGTILSGNFIGVDYSGATAVPNNVGIYGELCGDITIESNVISGNKSNGIQLQTVDGALFSRNMIGVNALGDTALANGKHGVVLYNNTKSCTVGGSSDYSNANVI